MNAKLGLFEHAKCDGDHHDFSITIKHAVCEISPHPMNNPLGIAAADIRAPAGVPCLELQEIDISLSFSNAGVNLEQLPKQADNLRGPGTLESFKSSHDEDFNFSYALGHTEDRQFSHFTPEYCSQTTGNYISVGDSVCEDGEMLDMDLLLYQADNSSPSLTREYLAQSSLFMYNNYVNAVTDGNKSLPLNLPCARKLIDFALRVLIGGRQIKSQGGLKLMKPYPTQCLSRIAPALWNPGFLQVRLARHFGYAYFRRFAYHCPIGHVTTLDVSIDHITGAFFVVSAQRSMPNFRAKTYEPFLTKNSILSSGRWRRICCWRR